jgi:putative ATPase
LNRVIETIEKTPAFPVPLQLRNAPTGLMKELGYSLGYQHAHGDPNALTDMTCLPEELAGSTFYEPTSRGFEEKLQDRLRWLKNKRSERQSDRRDTAEG